MRTSRTPRKQTDKRRELATEALLYLDLGHELYRALDPLASPEEEVTHLELQAYGVSRAGFFKIVRHGMEQIVAGKGWTEDNPFEDIEIPGFYTMLNLLHYEVTQQTLYDHDRDYILDQMHLVHKSSGRAIVLYNRVPTPTKRRRDARSGNSRTMSARLGLEESARITAT